MLVKNVTCVKNVDVKLYDRVPIAPVPSNEVVFDTFVMDCLGPIFPNQKVKFNYCLVLCDSVKITNGLCFIVINC